MSENVCPSIIQKHWISEAEKTSPKEPRKLVAGINMYTATQDSRDIEAGAAKTYPK